ncbi:MAG TPA: TetR/AcrR family transcriptional regulator [Rhizobiaceae bacterium]|nr:TetR/AcrR family transcriptional regulator [Rhizobiaceae bacterium]
MPAAARTPEDPPLRRKANKQLRRQQLIEATIVTLARRGYARTTMTDVAVTAGLSHGLVNFHFETKEKLLTETLQYLAKEYRDNWVRALAMASDEPAAQLAALIEADFNAEICTEDRLAAWCAFWGEAQCRPIYQQECGANDEEYGRVLEGICARLTEEGGYPFPPERVGRVVRVTMEGVWLELMTMTKPYSREEAKRTVLTCVAAFFPRHFGVEGEVANSE